MGMTLTAKEKWTAEKSWKVLNSSILVPKGQAMKDISSIRYVKNQYDEWKIAINVNLSETTEATIWIPADIIMQKECVHSDLLDKKTLKLYLLYNEDVDNEFELGEQTKEFILNNYEGNWALKVIEYAKKHPVKLFAFAKKLVK